MKDEGRPRTLPKKTKIFSFHLNIWPFEVTQNLPKKRTIPVFFNRERYYGVNEHFIGWTTTLLKPSFFSNTSGGRSFEQRKKGNEVKKI